VHLPWLAHDEAQGPYITIPQYRFNKTKQHTQWCASVSMCAFVCVCDFTLFMCSVCVCVCVRARAHARVSFRAYLYRDALLAQWWFSKKVQAREGKYG